VVGPVRICHVVARITFDTLSMITCFLRVKEEYQGVAKSE
jgi:hypothetical protein